MVLEARVVVGLRPGELGSVIEVSGEGGECLRRKISAELSRALSFFHVSGDRLHELGFGTEGRGSHRVVGGGEGKQGANQAVTAPVTGGGKIGRSYKSFPDRTRVNAMPVGFRGDAVLQFGFRVFESMNQQITSFFEVGGNHGFL